MDATTNWAAATTAAMITFSFGSPAAPHFILLLTLAFDSVFLLMESRRYQTYDLWRRRFRTLNRYLIAPALSQRHSLEPELVADRLAGVADDLGRTVPYLSVREAVGYRIHRNYGYIFAVTLVAWLLKLQSQPSPAASVGQLVERAAIGPLPGAAVLVAVGIFMVATGVLATMAPSEGMLDWAEVPSPMSRWLARSRRRPGTSPPGEQ